MFLQGGCCYHLSLSLLFLVLACSFYPRPLFANATELLYDVVSYGAKGDGRTDDTDAFLKAWEAACSAHTPDDLQKQTPVLYVPKGKTFLLQRLQFNGPCTSSSIHVQISGTLMAPKSLESWKAGCQDEWIGFERVNNLKIDGGGRIYGNGPIWWDSENFRRMLKLHACDNLQLHHLEFVDSPKNHLSIGGSKGADISNLHMIAPGESPNTDGINLAGVSDIHVYDSNIGTGDDCFALNGGCSRINITNVYCGPGHGISIGSLGKDGLTETVEEIYISNCTLNGTQNGVRIKTWPGGRGHAKKITFHDIVMLDSYNPIIIDQDYCNGKAKCNPGSTAVEIRDITYSDIRGTSRLPSAVSLNCSTVGDGCKNIVMDNIHLETTGKDFDGKLVYATCINAQGTARDVVPPVKCLSSHEPLVF
uniref:Polygalacturonase n=1 Tax=Kalanchoe fedtschenkoi TaxID=63787 RepID=A0A7N0VID9_KALFE